MKEEKVSEEERTDTSITDEIEKQPLRTTSTGSPLVQISNDTCTYTSTQTEDLPICLFCFETFTDEFYLQAHLSTQRHNPLNEMVTYNYRLTKNTWCMVCKNDVRSMSGFIHRCLDDVARSHKKMEHLSFSYGSCLACFLCADTELYSYYHLIIHIIIRHGFEGKLVSRGKNPCPFCYTLLKTDKRAVLEYHAVKEHMPELFMAYIKEIQPEGADTAVFKNKFSCKIPTCSSLYPLPSKPARKAKNCTEQFQYLTQFVAHLQSVHSPIPNRPLKFPLGKYPCRHCLVSFPDSSSLREHIQRKHEFINRQRANYCKSQQKLNRQLGDLTCKICWHKFRSVYQLQVHIQAAHLGPWRKCGLCGREYSKLNEVRAAKLIYMEIIAHERHHARELHEHAQTMLKIEMGELQAFKKPPPLVTDKYFSRINLDVAESKRVVVKRDYTNEFVEIGQRNLNVQTEMMIMGTIVQ